jgi:hypothetical protein
MAIDFGALQRLPDGSVKFFLTFTRCEFALKENGYVLPDRNGGVKADWDCFSDELEAVGFFDEIVESGRAATLISRPPKRQILNDGLLDWRTIPSALNTRQLFEGIRRVRNNLVHGGKSGDPDRDPENHNRGRDLIAQAQWVLEQALDKNDRVRWDFEGLY